MLGMIDSYKIIQTIIRIIGQDEKLQKEVWSIVKWWSLLIGVLAVAAASPDAWPAGTTLDAVHAMQRGHVTQFDFTLSRVPRYSYFALGSPPRAVLDLQGTRDRWPEPALPLPAVRSIRIGRHADGMLRVVFNLRPGSTLIGVFQEGPHDLLMKINNGSVFGGPADAQPLRKSTSARPVVVRNVEAEKRTPIVVVIDPGHGGRDPGTTGPDGLHEKTVTLAIAKILYRELKEVPNIQPVLTRDRNTYVSLPERVAIAQEHRANLFVSIHENAYPNAPQIEGGACYILSRHGASDAKAAQLARFENSADPDLDGVHFTHNRTLNKVLTDLFQTASINAEDHLAQDIISQLGRVEPLYRSTPLRANFEVLRDPMIPSVLCETAFLSNRHQAAELHHKRFRLEIATAIERGILRYLHNYAPTRVEPGPPTYDAESTSSDVSARPATVNASKGGDATGYSTRTYRVRNGDTLSGLAAENHVSVGRLMRLNALHSPRLRIGQLIQIPGTSPVANARPVRTALYTVRPGDRLSIIAFRQHTSVGRLEQLNGLHGSLIRIGQQLRIPETGHGFRRYIVRAGDTLSQLAAEHGVSTRRLQQVNHLTGTGLQVGESLFIPRGGTG